MAGRPPTTRPGRRRDYRQEAEKPGTHHGAPSPGPYDDPRARQAVTPPPVAATADQTAAITLNPKTLHFIDSQCNAMH